MVYQIFRLPPKFQKVLYLNNSGNRVEFESNLRTDAKRYLTQILTR